MKSFSLYTLITLVALGGLNPAFGSSIDIRDYRRAALAIGGRLPTPAEIESILAGRLAYQSFVEQLLRSSGFEERMTEQLWMRFVNTQISDAELSRLTVSDYALKSNMRPGLDLGGGLSVRPAMGFMKKAGGAYQNFAPDFGTIGDSKHEHLEICGKDQKCVVEAPVKALMAAASRGQCSLVSSYASGIRSASFPANLPAHIPDCATSLTRTELGLHYSYPFLHWGYHGDVLFPALSAVQKLPGYYAGCRHPEIDPQTLTANSVDSVNAPLQAGSLLAVPIHPWWDPQSTIYACPGVALQAAFGNSGTIPFQGTPYPAPQTFVAGANAYTLEPGKPDKVFACTAYNQDTAYNPHCDCGPQFQNCILVRQLVSKSVNFQAQAAFRHILRGKLPYRNLLDGNFRSTNRVIEWLDLVLNRDPLQYARAAHDPSVQWGPNFRFNESIRNDRLMQYNGPRSDFASLIEGLPAMPQERWLEDRFQYGRGFGDLANQEYKTKRIEPDWHTSFRIKGASRDPSQVRHSGILSTYTLTLGIPSIRSRSARIASFFQCTDFGKLASLSGNPDPTQQGAPLHARNECKSCHLTIEPMSAFFGGTWGRDNHNFSGLVQITDGQTPTNPGFQRSGRFGHGEVFVPLSQFARTPNSFGTDPLTQLPFTWKGRSALEELPALAQVLTESQSFNACALQRVWEALLGRVPSTQERSALDSLQRGLTGRDYSIQDYVRFVANSNAFREGVKK